MSHNTNKLFWLSALSIVVVVTCVTVINSVTNPSKTLYNNAEAETLCNAIYKDKLVSCLDASSNSALGQHNSNKSDEKSIWYDQTGSLNASLTNFEFNEKSGWEETSLLFDGVNDNLKVKTNSISSEEFSLLLNLKLVSLPSEKVLLVNSDNFKVYLNSNGKLEINLNETTVSSNSLIKPEAWYSITIVYNNDLLKIYINGQTDSYIEANLGKITLADELTIGNKINMYLSSYAIWEGELTKDNVIQNTSALNNKTLDIAKYYASFDYTGDCEEWYVPIEGTYQIELWGAQGNGENSTGGKGAYTSGNIDLKKGQKLYVCIGSGGNLESTNFNGGGEGTYAGGGESDIRLVYNGQTQEFASLKSRIMVAAGGGAAVNAQGGVGGTVSGSNSTTQITGIINATGGKQKTGGSSARKKDGFGDSLNIYTEGSNGIFGQGGSTVTGAGGGAGYFGGGAISTEGGAAGGSSYVSGYKGSYSLSADSEVANMIFSTASHYSGYVFESPYMVSGGTQMKDPITEETMTGKSGNGYGKITLITAKAFVEEKEPITINFEKPGTPVVKNTVITDNGIEISFDETSNTTEYSCFYGTSPDNLANEGYISTVTGQQQKCLIRDLNQNSTYYYILKSINGDKETSSEIYSFTTNYKIPKRGTVGMYDIKDTSLDVTWNVDEHSTDYVCAIGSSEGNINLKGTYSKNGNDVVCHFENLDQNTTYFTTIETTNVDKVSLSEALEVKTEYSEPLDIDIVRQEITENSIKLSFKTINHYTNIKCLIGTNSTNLDKEMNVVVEEDTLHCSMDNLEQGKLYYIKVIIDNGTKHKESTIYPIKTVYESLKTPELVNEVIGSDYITTTYNVFNALDLPEARFICSYGTDENNLDRAGTATINLDGTVSCNYIGLGENTVYLNRLGIINGDKTVHSEIKATKTDYTMPEEPSYTSSSISDKSNFTAEYTVGNTSYSFDCNASKKRGEDDIKGLPSIDEENSSVVCSYSNLTGGTYYYYLTTKNGDYKVDSEIKSVDIDITVPDFVITVDNNQFNDNGWAKEDITVNVNASTPLVGQLFGIAVYQGTTLGDPEINIDVSRGLTEYTAANDKTTVYLTGTGSINQDIIIDENSKTNYVCVSLITDEGLQTPSCVGPYKLDKIAPEFTAADITIPDTTLTYDIYAETTLSDNLSANAEITREYDVTPSWGDNGIYSVKYTITDLAGNVTNVERTFTITLTTFNINYTMNGGTLADAKTTYNKTEAFTIGEPTRFGYTFDGWTGDNGTTKQKTIDIPVGTMYDKNYTANWTKNTYSISYTLNSGSISGQPTTYTVTDTFTLPQPTRTGYTFTGWTGSNGTTPQKTVTITAGTKAENLSYTANWQINTYFVDVNPIIQGTKHNNGVSSFTFRVYKNGTLIANNVTDWSGNIEYGATIRVIANGRSGYNITANGDTSKTITSSAEFNPTWTDNIAPNITGHSFTNWGGGTGNQCWSTDEAGTGLGHVDVAFYNASGREYKYSYYDGRTCDAWDSITASGTFTWCVWVWDNAGNYGGQNCINAWISR